MGTSSKGENASISGACAAIAAARYDTSHVGGRRWGGRYSSGYDGSGAGVGVGVGKDEGESVDASCCISSLAIARGVLMGEGVFELEDELVSRSASYPEDPPCSSSVVALSTPAA